MEELQIQAGESGVKLTDKQVASFVIFEQELTEWNKKINLTGITEKSEILVKHFLDSLIVTTVIPEAAESLLDIGTGAGFPGLPIAIVCPRLKITLVDSIRKKLAFVDNIITKLNLHGVKVLNMRAEDLGRDKIFREKFDVVTARAVAYLPTLVEYTLPLVKVGGIFIAQKLANDEEIQSARQAIRTLGGQIKEIKKYKLPGLDERALIIIEKIEKTPDIFPRQTSEIKSDPL